MRKINVYSLLIVTLLIYILFALLQSVIPFNKIFGALIPLELLIISFFSLKKRDIWTLFYIIIVTFFSIMNMKEFSEPNEDIIYFPIAVLVLSKMLDKSVINRLSKELLKFRKFIYYEVIVINIILLIGLFLPQCYSTNMGETVYKGFTYSGHTFASCISLTLSIYIFYLVDEKKYFIKILWVILPLYCIFLSGARTFLISVFLILCILYERKIKYVKNSKLIIAIFFIVMIIMFMSSSLYDKFFETANNKYISENKLEAITSGRLIWWRYDLQAFQELNWFQKIFGAGHELVYDVNKEMYGLYIWAHNDFIQVLVSLGLFGFLGYCMLIINIYIKLRKENKKYAIILLAYIMCAAIVNGFYKYQHYVFSSFVLLLLLYKDTLLYADKKDKVLEEK